MIKSIIIIIIIIIIINLGLDPLKDKFNIIINMINIIICILNIIIFIIIKTINIKNIIIVIYLL